MNTVTRDLCFSLSLSRSFVLIKFFILLAKRDILSELRDIRLGEFRFKKVTQLKSSKEHAVIRRFMNRVKERFFIKREIIIKIDGKESSVCMYTGVFARAHRYSARARCSATLS